VGTLRSAIKGAAERALGSDLVGRLSTVWLREQRLVLAYHNIVKATHPGGDASLHCPFDRFRAHLDLLQSRGHIGPLEAVLEARAGGPRVAISFDDAYRGALEHGLPELAARDLPVTVFVSPGLLGNAVTWWDALSGRVGLDEDLRTRCLEEFAGSSAEIQEWAGRTGLRWLQAGPELGIASEAELAAAAASKGITLAGHSWSHPNLTRVDEGQLAAEMKRPLDWLRERFPSEARPWLAYPYGLADARVEAAARAAGYVAAFRVSGGWTRSDDPSMGMARLNIPAGLSPRGLAARLSGFLG
jgi:peptidoglycan/xylan/chitin deacetylase (PgdA/CDA1 family)